MRERRDGSGEVATNHLAACKETSCASDRGRGTGVSSWRTARRREGSNEGRGRGA